MDIENPVAETFAGCMHLAAEIVAYSAAATIITLFRSIFEVGQNQFEWNIELVTFEQGVRWFIGSRWTRSKSSHSIVSYLVVLGSTTTTTRTASI